MTKKLLILLFCTFMISCSSDDDSVMNNNDDEAIIDDEEIDPIIGTWGPEKRVILYGDGSTDEEMASECDLMDRVIFEQDGEFDLLSHFYYNGGCQSMINVIEGDWSKMTDTRYAIYFKYHSIDDDTDIMEESTVFNVSFPSSDYFYIHDQDAVDYLQEEGHDVVDVYAVVVRISDE